MQEKVKYAIQPLYIKKEINNQEFKLLKGYIVSKCYVLDTNKVLFPYSFYDKKINEKNRRTINDIRDEYNTNYVDNLYDDYESAKIDCDIKNKSIGLNGNKRRTLKAIEKLIDKYTFDMIIENEKKR